MTTQILRQEAGRYALLKDGERYYASVDCGSSAMYSLNIPITREQFDEVMNDSVLLDQLVGRIAFAPQRYLAQHVDLSD
jgi:hypothetical protein